jgi:hypothetical protein
MGAAQSNTDFDRPLRDGQAGRILRGRRRQQSRMFRTRLTWVIVGGVATLLIVAGVDALRSSKNELPAATTTAAMTSPEGAEVTLPRCARGQITISLEVRRRIVVNAVENVGSGPCHLGSVMLGLTMEDRAGKTAWQGALPSALWGISNHARSRLCASRSRTTFHAVTDETRFSWWRPRATTPIVAGSRAARSVAGDWTIRKFSSRCPASGGQDAAAPPPPPARGTRARLPGRRRRRAGLATPAPATRSEQ